MNPNDSLEEAIELLQLLGLNEYEARCYVALTRMDEATSRDLSEVADVPRTRVYDAIRVLDAQGLVEVMESSPKQFRAVSIDEAVDRIRTRYETRFDELRDALHTVEAAESTGDCPTQQVWSVAGREPVESRAIQLVKEASTEVVLVVGDESLLTEQFVETLAETGDGLEVVVYAPTESVRNRIRATDPSVTTGSSRPEALHGPAVDDTQVALGRLLLIDRSAALLSSVDLDTGEERAVFSQGSKTPLVPFVGQFVADDGSVGTPEPEP